MNRKTLLNKKPPCIRKTAIEIMIELFVKVANQLFLLGFLPKRKYRPV